MIVLENIETAPITSASGMVKLNARATARPVTANTMQLETVTTVASRSILNSFWDAG